jgi:hypothetical protein
MYYILFIIIFLLFSYYIHKRKNNYLYVSDSLIHNKGVFSSRSYKKGDIIQEDLFPYNKQKEMLYLPISKQKFDTYISYYGKFYNHCTTNYNANLTTDDYILYQLVALQDIPIGSEITANYDIIHSNFPFIAGSQKHFKQC